MYIYWKEKQKAKPSAQKVIFLYGTNCCCLQVEEFLLFPRNQQNFEDLGTRKQSSNKQTIVAIWAYVLNTELQGLFVFTLLSTKEPGVTLFAVLISEEQTSVLLLDLVMGPKTKQSKKWVWIFESIDHSCLEVKSILVLKKELVSMLLQKYRQSGPIKLAHLCVVRRVYRH